MEEQIAKSVRLEMDRTKLKTDLKTALTNPYIILLALVVLVTANSLKNGFLGDDDSILIVNNPRIDLSLKELPSLFMKPLGAVPGRINQTFNFHYYRPILELLYVCDYKVWGLNPVGFHLTNILFHFLNVIFVYHIGLLLFRNDKTISLIAAALFAVHPVNSEPLGRVALNENVFGLFMILAVFFFIKEREFLSWLTFSVALLSKESAVMLPFALCILLINKSGLKKGIGVIMPYMLILGIYFVLRLIVVGPSLGMDLPQKSLPELLAMAAAFLDYVRLLILPYPLHAFYPARVYSSILHPKVLLSLPIIAILLFLAFNLRKDRTMLFLLLSPFILLAPVIVNVNSFPLGVDKGYIAERFLYVPAMLFSLFVSGITMRFGDTNARRRLVTAFSVIVIAFAGLTMSSSQTWADNMTFFSQMAKDAPDSSVTHYYKGTIFYSQGKLEDARKEFETALYPNPSSYTRNINYYGVHDSNGEGLARKNKRLKYEALSLALWEHQPVFAHIHFNLGRIYMAQGDVSRAIRKFKVTIILQPNFQYAHYYLGYAYMKTGQFDKAASEFRTYLRRD